MPCPARGYSDAMPRATILNCTLKPSPGRSNTEALASVLIDALESADVRCELIRVVDLDIKPGVESDQGDGDEWPGVLEKILGSQILVIATPTWLGRPSSVAQRVLERLDALLSETDEEGRPVAYNRVAGVVVTGNEDGAHHVISEVSGALGDIGFTIPGQSWTYWNRDQGPGRTTSTPRRARTGRTPPRPRRRRTCSAPPARSPRTRSARRRAATEAIQASRGASQLSSSWMKAASPTSVSSKRYFG
jgi:multimeric flavodoxin WrbA